MLSLNDFGLNKGAEETAVREFSYMGSMRFFTLFLRDFSPNIKRVLNEYI
jgi:hypothetical protein|tara:strand:+ start:724 stop:873 length:150 start_codon:yes stop_codon:yes gene_type:complete